MMPTQNLRSMKFSSRNRILGVLMSDGDVVGIMLRIVVFYVDGLWFTVREKVLWIEDVHCGGRGLME